MSKDNNPRKGNTNAQKADAPATSNIHMRVTTDKKVSYVRQANAEGMRLTEWIQKHLDAAVTKAEKSKKASPDTE
ncbi:TPA: hypothetical protein ACGQ50_000809 [Enterobacter cloacae]